METILIQIPINTRNVKNLRTEEDFQAEVERQFQSFAKARCQKIAEQLYLSFYHAFHKLEKVKTRHRFITDKTREFYRSMKKEDKDELRNLLLEILKEEAAKLDQN